MSIPESNLVITQTKKWINDVVAGCGFCPFAAKEIKQGTIHYEVISNASSQSALEAIVKAFHALDNDEKIATSFLILPGSFGMFTDYLDLLDMAEKLLSKENYEGIYQLASFHPGYLFAGSLESDPANYTNRSPYPMFHFLREDALTKAIDSYPDIDNIPSRNIAFANTKGLKYMQQLLISSMETEA
jgi:uncharacterized protein